VAVVVKQIDLYDGHRIVLVIFALNFLLHVPVAFLMIAHAGDELPPIRTKIAGLSSEKATRVRTVLNEKQLQTLRTCYAANPRPDALMKEQLVEMTSLSPRVIRVWFQNKRCKDKKRSILIKQMQQQGGDKTVRELNFDGDNNCQIVNNNNLTE